MMLWIKLMWGPRKYHHTLLDSISNLIVVDAIYNAGDEITVGKFLKDYTAN